MRASERTARKTDVALDACALEVAFSNLLPPQATVRAGPFARFRGVLLPGEAAAISNAVAGRQKEFRAGRICAREALAAAHRPCTEIGVGPGRQPLWGPGSVGSIAHAAGVCAAAVAGQNQITHLGIDIERVRAVEPALVGQVLSDAEAEHLAEAPADLRSAATIAFSMKESIFKAVYPATGVFFDFLDIALEPAGAPGRLRACALKRDVPGADLIPALSLSFCVAGGLVLSAAVIEGAGILAETGR